MRVHYINLRSPAKNAAQSRATVGGSPILPSDQQWPLCRLCKTPMTFFFQLDLQKSFDLPLKSLSHLVVFMCPVHNDVPTQLVESGDEQLPADFWQKSFGHYFMMLFKPGKPEHALAADKHIAERQLTFTEAEEDIDWDGKMERGSAGLKVGGVPHWEGTSAYTTCACGSEMVFVCQVPSDFHFPQVEGAPPPPNAVSGDKYSLFLGKPTFIFACKEQCSPYALHAVSQDLVGDLAESA